MHYRDYTGHIYLCSNCSVELALKPSDYQASLAPLYCSTECKDGGEVRNALATTPRKSYKCTFRDRSGKAWIVTIRAAARGVAAEVARVHILSQSGRDPWLQFVSAEPGWGQ